MTKRRLYFALFFISLAGLVFYVRNRPVQTPPVTAKKEKTPEKAPEIDAESLQIEGKRVVGLRPGHEKEDIKKLKVANTPSPEWKPALEETLRAQGGNAIKEIKFDKVDSFVWAHDGVALFVESVIVTLKNDKNVPTTFRVLVDAQNGKILKNWDHPVFDPANPRESFRIKIDPRYHAD